MESFEQALLGKASAPHITRPPKHTAGQSSTACDPQRLIWAASAHLGTQVELSEQALLGQVALG